MTPCCLSADWRLELKTHLARLEAREEEPRGVGDDADNDARGAQVEAGAGLRLDRSHHARKGYVDHQTLSFDAYLKFIEDDFLSGQRLDPKTDGRPDPRPIVRENVSTLGDLSRDFDFDQSPRPPLVLATNPPPGPASTP